MIRFDYLEPRTLAEASAALRGHDGFASVLAGGTDLLVEIKEHLRRVKCVVNIKRIPGLDAISFDAVTGLRFGALTTARAIELHADVARHYPGLTQAVRELGSIQVRHRATVAGNICRASPSADTLPPLIADGASVVIGDGNRSRALLLEAFFTGPGKTSLQPGELVLAIHVPAPPPAPARTGRAYLKHGRRKAMELATVGVAVSLTLDPSHVCTQARIALGAVAPTPIRARAAEAALEGQRLDPAAIDAGVIAHAAELAAAASSPISNVRASAAYRRAMVSVLTHRALLQALARAAPG